MTLPPEVMTASRITAQGFEALLERALLHPDSRAAHLLSIVGPREAVRALWAKGISGHEVLISSAGRFRRPTFYNMTMRQQKLPSGATHLLVASKAVLAGRVIVARTGAELEDRVWASIQRGCRTPLHASWRDFALERVARVELESFGPVLGCALEGLDRFGGLVREAVKAGVLCA